MNKLPPLTKVQKEKLAVLEPQLKQCIKTADLNKAKKLTFEIQELLRPTGHGTRILQAKNWLYETAMETNNLTFAKMGFEGTIQKISNKTRVYLEATSLLAICYLREENIEKARDLIHKAIKNVNNIKTESKRKQFHQRLIQRLEEESILIGLVDNTGRPLELEKVDNEAVKLVMTKSNDQIMSEMGNAVPQKSVDLLLNIRDAYQGMLPGPDRNFYLLHRKKKIKKSWEKEHIPHLDVLLGKLYVIQTVKYTKHGHKVFQLFMIKSI